MNASAPLEKTLLRLFAEAKGHNLSATAIKAKLATASKKSPEAGADAETIDQALTALIDDGHLTVTGAAKTGHHPRARGTYSLTNAGKDHTKPKKPDASADIIAYQEAYILLQFLRVKQDQEASMTRSELNGKLKTKSAVGSLEFVPENAKETIDYHLHNLVGAGRLEEKRQGVSTRYTLTDEGREALGAADQYETISFTFTGAALNTLLKAAREPSAKTSKDRGGETDGPKPPQPVLPEPPALDPKQIHDFIAHLKADKYAGRDLIPIHEVRTLVAHHHGPEAAGHPVFDPLLKRMRSEGELEIIAIADSRDTPQQHLDDSIPGMNETLFFIDTE